MAFPTKKSVENLLTTCGYRYKDVTAKDAANLLGAYRDLRAGVDTCVFGDGSSKELVNISGTIPLHYKGNIYNIPVQLWLFDTHPYLPPYCFVKPTSSMLIKVGKHVGKDGRIYLPYLHEWKAHASDLLGLVQVMLAVFGEQPPLYSRSHSISVVIPPVARIYQNYPWYPVPNPPAEEQKELATAAHGMTTNSSAAGSGPFYPAPKPPVEERTAAAAAAHANKSTEEELRRLQDRHTCKVTRYPAVAMAFGAYLKHLWNKEPVIMASLGIGMTALILPFVSPLTKFSRKLSLASPYYYPVPVRDDGNMPDVPQHPCEKKGNSLEWLKNF